jgi:hypothetical protein
VEEANFLLFVSLFQVNFLLQWENKKTQKISVFIGGCAQFTSRNHLIAARSSFFSLRNFEFSQTCRLEIHKEVRSLRTTGPEGALLPGKATLNRLFLSTTDPVANTLHFAIFRTSNGSANLYLIIYANGAFRPATQEELLRKEEMKVAFRLMYQRENCFR